jgi:4-amino-4-deoxy-L-arabinose transferase-like glycosyltransferase
MSDADAPSVSMRAPRVAPILWIAVVLGALFTRLAFVAIMPHSILWPDGLEYEAVAKSLLAHQGYGLQTLRPPGYPTLIAAVYGLCGQSLFALRVVEALLGTVSVALVGAIGARVAGPVAGLIAAGIMAVHPVMAFLPSTQYSENTVVLFVTLAMGAVFAATRAGETRGRWWRWAIAGGLFGLAALVRPTTAFLLPGLAVGLALALSAANRPRVAPALVAALAFALVVAPWVVRCHEMHGRWFFIASGGGRQFWVGNNPRATAETSAPTQWNAAERESLAAQPDDLARERWHYRQGWRFVRAEPGRAARLYVRELGNLFSLWPETFSRQVAIGAAGRWAQGAASLVIFAGALLSLAGLRESRHLWPVLGAVVSFALLSAVFFTVMRYRMVIEPLLLWMAGVGWGATRWGAALGGTRPVATERWWPPGVSR